MTWSQLLKKSPKPHVVIGWTRNVNRWRDEGFFDLVGIRRLAGHYSVKRDFDARRGKYLLLAAFEQENDARELAKAIGAETSERHTGYASQRYFKYSSKLRLALKSATLRE